MKRFAACITVALACILTGCASTSAKGYFYVTSNYDGYVVAMDGDADFPSLSPHTTRYITKPMPLADATAMCNDLNHRMAGHTRE